MFRGRETLPPIILQILGAVMIIFFTGFWAFTKQIEPVLLGVAGTLISAGLVKQSGEKLKPTDADNGGEEAK